MKRFIIVFPAIFLWLSALGQPAIKRNTATTNEFPKVWSSNVQDSVTVEFKGGRSLSTNASTITVDYGSNAIIQVFPNGTAYGPTGKIDTAGTKTVGISEAIHALYQTNGTGLVVGGGKIVLAPGVYDCTTNITIPNQFNFELVMEGAGKSATLIIDSTVGTNFLVLENVDANSSITNGGSKPFQYYFRNFGLTKRYDTNLTALAYFGNKVNQGVWDNCAFSSMQCLMLTATNGANPPGQGGGLLFISGTPTNAVGTVGIRLIGGYDNKQLIRKCDFYGLAVGVFAQPDHIKIEDCMFAACGRWYTAGGITPHDATAYTAVGTYGSISQRVNNILSVGGGIVGMDSIYDFTIENCYFFESRGGVINAGITGFGPVMRILYPHWESCSYGLLHTLDENDESLGGTSMFLTEPTAVSLTSYLKLTNGTISASVPTTPAELAVLGNFASGGSFLKWTTIAGDKLIMDGTGAAYFAGPASASTFLLSTNATANNGVLNPGETVTNLAGNITIAGFSGIDFTRWNSYLLIATNGNSGADRSVTMPATVFGVNGTTAPVFWVTNNHETTISIGIRKGRTNAVEQRF